MAKLKRTAFVNAGERIRELPQARRQRVEALASEMAAELHFCENSAKERQTGQIEGERRRRQHRESQP